MNKIRFIIFSICIFLLCIFVNKIYAQDVPFFYDDFTSSELDFEKWDLNLNGGDVELNSGIINLSSPTFNDFPFVRTKVNPFPSRGSFTLEFRAAFPQITPWGVGLLFCSSIVNNKISRSDPINSRIFTYHADTSQNTFWFRFLMEYYLDNPEIRLYAQKDNDFHIVTVIYNDRNNQYTYYIDGHQIYNNSTSIRPVFLFFGSPYFQQATPEPTEWTSISIDYIKIFEGLYPPIITIPSPSPSPTPPPTAGNVVLLVPGHGASLNLTDLLTNVHQGEWKRMPYFYTEVYGSLIDSLRNAGYSFDNNKFYEFTYDWTRPVDEISDNLKNYINNTIMPENPNKKIDIVAHSLGGLVSRNWLQKNSDAPSKLNKLITVGSPHEGVVDTYAAWEGGEVWRDDPIQKFAFELPLYLFKQKYISKTQALREIAPSTGDLLPIFDYLKNRDGSIKHYNDLADAKNDFLTGLRDHLDDNLKNRINIYRGNNFDTLDSLVIKERTKAEEALDQWMDGRPMQKEYTKSGDGTVLSKSSNIDNKDFKEVNLNHVDLIKTSDGIKNIFNILGIPNQYINTNFKTEENQKYLAFVTNPPTCVTVTDDLGKKLGCNANNQLITENRISSGDSDESGGLIIINNPIGQTYSLETKPKGLEKTELIKIEMENQNIHFKKYPLSLNSNNNFFFIKDKNYSYNLSKNGIVINISTKYDNLYNSVYSDLSTTSYKQIFLYKLFVEKENLQKINQYISLGWNKKAGEEILKSQSEIIKLIKVAQKMFIDNESDFFLIKQEILDIVSDLKDLYLTLPLELNPHEVEVNLASLDNRLKYLENKFDQKENYRELKDTAWDLQYINNLLSKAYNFWSVSDYQSANIYSYLGEQISREIDLK